VVHAAWQEAESRLVEPTLMQKTDQVHEELHEWDRHVLKGPCKRIEILKTKLEEARRAPIDDESLATQTNLLLQIEALLEQEEIHWFKEEGQTG
jgi:predicted component of type VI protein secretion system